VKITNSKNAQHIVTQGNVVSLAYTITDSEGVEVDSTTESGPFQYIQGSKMLILGLLFQVDEIRPGMQFSIMTEDGLRIATIDSLDGNDVIVDLNHPLSGKDIMIKSKILGIRKATDEELRREEINQ